MSIGVSKANIIHVKKKISATFFRPHIAYVFEVRMPRIYYVCGGTSYVPPLRTRRSDKMSFFCVRKNDEVRIL